MPVAVVTASQGKNSDVAGTTLLSGIRIRAFAEIDDVYLVQKCLGQLMLVGLVTSLDV